MCSNMTVEIEKGGGSDESSSDEEQQVGQDIRFINTNCVKVNRRGSNDSCINGKRPLCIHRKIDESSIPTTKHGEVYFVRKIRELLCSPCSIG